MVGIHCSMIHRPATASSIILQYAWVTARQRTHGALHPIHVPGLECIAQPQRQLRGLLRLARERLYHASTARCPALLQLRCVSAKQSLSAIYRNATCMFTTPRPLNPMFLLGGVVNFNANDQKSQYPRVRHNSKQKLRNVVMGRSSQHLKHSGAYVTSLSILSHDKLSYNNNIIISIVTAVLFSPLLLPPVSLR